MSAHEYEGDTPAGMPGGKAMLRQQMFELARQSLDEEQVESVAFQATPAKPEDLPTDAGAAASALPEDEAHTTVGVATPHKRRRGIRRVRRKAPPIITD